MDIFLAGFWILCCICAILFLYTRSTTQRSEDAAFGKFQRTYLAVYLLAMAGDWLQGPHVYALYDNYGMTTHQIEILFVAGFGSSMIVGTVVGSFADKYGRRSNCILYGVLYGAACITKHFNNFWVLMLGRLLGGTATSILYSAFESWLIFEHNKRGFDPELVGTIFSHAILGNSVVAITSGIVAESFANYFGYVAPFDASLCVLILMSIIIVFTWPENYGNKTIELKKSMTNAMQAIHSDSRVLCLGLIQALFEGSMYVFVLEWTPALTLPDKPVASPAHTESHRRLLTDDTSESHKDHIPHGIIFAAFMVSIMIGSSLFKLLINHTTVESFMRPVLFLSAVALAMPVIFPGNQLFIFISFLMFEVCVGIFWPSMSTMRGKYVPEETRATVMNFFRIPLNFIVIAILLKNLPQSIIFQCCVIFLLLASLSQHWLYRLCASHHETGRGKGEQLLPSGEEV